MCSNLSRASQSFSCARVSTSLICSQACAHNMQTSYITFFFRLALPSPKSLINLASKSKFPSLFRKENGRNDGAQEYSSADFWLIFWREIYTLEFFSSLITWREKFLSQHHSLKTSGSGSIKYDAGKYNARDFD